ncbi:hypothetical protein [Pseudonocardia sp. D17]|uniref:hypothetical protein n=1 Tax=Pseudonocardia sp. D17 TaxID=882661 RepID=UPI002B3B4DE9|nr:hypothetical protein PSD17_14160 [Pseudonocardia sp. D17]
MGSEAEGVVQRVQDAQDRAVELGSRLSDLAHQFGHTCEELARQNDLLAENRRPPIQFDHRMAAKSWRVLADTATNLAEAGADARPWCDRPPRCPHCTEPVAPQMLLEVALGVAATARCGRCGSEAHMALMPVPPRGGRKASDPVGDAIAAEDLRIATALNDEVVQKLFAVGLRLGAALDSTNGVVRRRLEEAIGEMDASIALVRAIAFGLERDRADREP